MEYPNITLNFETYIELFNSYKELNQIRNLIEDNAILNIDKEIDFENNYSFTIDLVKLLKYTDEKYYDDLKKYLEHKQQGAEQ